ncbi:MAG: acyl-CoA thioesterase [Xenococcaceae cyanobacterium]
MSFSYCRTVRLGDTDAAGVVYFANVLHMCHEAYEESLVHADINLNLFLNDSSIAIPIIDASVKFFSPIICGDRLLITLETQQLDDNKFDINYRITSVDSTEKILATATTTHVAIDSIRRKKINLPDSIIGWLKISKEY